MKISGVPFCTVNWSEIEPVSYPGEMGTAFWRTFEMGNIRVRMVEYSPNYLADHWCSRGHVILCLEGKLETEMQDGRIFVLTPGMSYHVADGDGAHRSRTGESGAKLFIVD